MRQSGILLPLTALPGLWGVGTLGREAERFLDFLRAAGQSCWQILPIGPTGFGDSPYQSFSSFAGNPYLIDLDLLAEEGLLEREEYAALDWGSDPGRVDYGALYHSRLPVLRRACERLLSTPPEDYPEFCRENAFWLEDYALFMALKGAFGGGSWQTWPEELRRRDPETLRTWRTALAGECDFWRSVQYLFFRQWRAFRAKAKERDIALMGDLPIYVAEDSADVWAAPEQFQLDETLRPTQVAGVPPDAFTAEGQLWGNPLYDWPRMEAEGYRWWIRRLGYQFSLYDMLRLDHFRGFESYFAIPAGDADARRGVWKPGPGAAFFRAVEAALGRRTMVAEDLGYHTEALHRFLEEVGYPGMKVLQFAFDSRDTGSGYLPHTYTRNCVAYTGTHDNDTVLGWLATAPAEDVAHARAYLRLNEAEGEHLGMLRALWGCVADLTIAPMGDILGLGHEARINTPSTTGGNWTWRVPAERLTDELAGALRREMTLYDRIPTDGRDCQQRETVI